ncbi:receptor L domain-containing protein [Cyclobacterium marinum]|uniref:Epidermal growth-factor receptor (EGFR) L domain-containing protein n=1 Tax=Cyclobacterium marinum (strain ATCC 25205 / DSM 745 / LMG 13164 / NCIMB 1802) TaxID=880070 RepID=G0J6H3_CYCMS|nr:epidermal growth-factor receptor (EGFR) L domain-containing protein [Cyclobacterium marinum]AEL27668.1 epidermal growth-factor receptor (EGFR) L domain-containing protein [Cyclobacterium marinum DSM 745]
MREIILKFRLVLFILFISLGAGLVSCEEAEKPTVIPDPITNPGEEEENPENQEKLPTVVIKIAKTSNTSSRQLRVTAYSKAIITIQTANGDSTSYTNKNIQVQDMGDHYLTEKIILPEGSYQVVAFYVLDDNNNIVEATPKKNSSLSEDQNLSLPLTFELETIETEEEAEIQISMQVVTAEGHSPSDFGFQSFGLDIVTATSNKIYMAMVTDQRLMDFLPGSIEITADGEVITQELIAGINESVTLPIADSYAILFKSFNFDDFIDTLSFDQLKSYVEQPLVVEMIEAEIKCVGGEFIEDLVLTTQTELNDWALRCHTGIQGDLIIQGGDDQDPIVDLSPLELVTHVYGSLKIENTSNLKNLHGLQNLNLVEGWVTIDGNSSLETLEGLSLSENQQVHLTISSNPNLLNFNGLERINKLGYVIIRSNPKLVNFKGMDQVQEISGLEVSFNETQTSFEGLENVRLIGTLEIIGLNITNFNGFQGVESISSLTLYNLYDLEDFTGFTGTVTFSIDLMSNGIRKLEGLTVSEELSRVNIKDTSLGNLRELSNLKKITRSLTIQDNINFNSLEGLDNLVSVAGSMIIQSNNYLTNYCAISKLVNEGTHPKITIDNNGYNPTLEQIQGEECKGEMEW